MTSLRLRAKSCEFGDQEESLIRDCIVIGCVDPRLQKQLLREADLNLLKALNICRAAEATKEQVKLLQAGSIPVSSTTAVHVVNNNVSGTAIRNKNTGCHCCGMKYPPKSCPAYGKTCRTCGKPNHFASVCRSGQGTSKPVNKPNRRRRGPSKQRYKSETRSVSSLTDSTEDVFVGALYVNIDTVSEEKTS